jgi:glycyl-tRNA synthetase beta chain
VSERQDFLLELGTEELPPKALAALEAALAAGIATRLEHARLTHGAIESFATPRRLAVRVRRLSASQPPLMVKRRGPPLRAAFDDAGQPTRAALAFADSCGATVAGLGRETDAKGTEYLAYAGTQPGVTTVSLLPAIVQQALDALPIPKRMRWGAGAAEFVRPVHWLLLLYGREPVAATLLDTVSGTLTYGHRFMAPKALRITSPASYEKTLLTRGKVIASFAERRDRIREQTLSAAAGLGGTAIIGEALLDEVTALVEWPVAVVGKIEERFLALPREVLVAALQEHQRYFAVQRADGALLPCFICISNIESRDPPVVRHGNEKVVRARLSDAAFFWAQDRKQPLAALRAGLETVTFQAQLGSVGDKVRRVRALALAVGAQIGAQPELTAAAAECCKCDLISAMVGEFPELQGIMGRYYALADGLAPEIAEAIGEHYQPRGAGDALPATRAGLALAIADKLDTLAGIFSIGQKPSGTRDPFGLRRAAIGILRMAIERRLELDLIALIGQAVAAQPRAAGASSAEQIAAEVYGYVMERLRAQYLEQAGGISTEMFEAVLATAPASPLDFDARLRALLGFLARPEALSLTAANKRIANILKKSAAEATASVDPARLTEPAEAQLHAAMGALSDRVLSALAARQYAAALDLLAQLKPQVDAFFDQVLVNDPDTALRANRLGLLAALRALFAQVADLSRLPG